MTISVQNNPDGTFSVSCGNESITVGTPTATAPPSGASPGPGTIGGKKPPRPTTVPGGGVSVQLVKRPGDSLPSGLHDFTDFIEVKSHLKGLIAAKTAKEKGSPMLIEIGWIGTEVLDVGKLTGIVSGFGAPEIICKIVLPARDG